MSEIKFKVSGEGVPEVTPVHTLELSPKVRIIDVRRSEEFTGELGHVKGAELVTLETEFMSKLGSWSVDDTYVFVCRSGGRSAHATMVALTKGFKKVYNMEGGMLRWNAEKLPTEK